MNPLRDALASLTAMLGEAAPTKSPPAPTGEFAKLVGRLSENRSDAPPAPEAAPPSMTPSMLLMGLFANEGPPAAGDSPERAATPEQADAQAVDAPAPEATPAPAPNVCVSAAAASAGPVAPSMRIDLGDGRPRPTTDQPTAPISPRTKPPQPPRTDAPPETPELQSIQAGRWRAAGMQPTLAPTPYAGAQIDATPLVASSVAPNVTNVATEKARAAEAGVTAGNVAPEASRMPLRIDSIAVHLPPAIARSLVDDAEEAATPVSTPARVARDATHAHDKLKVLTFAVEPDSLGPICVRMRVTQSRVDIRIEAREETAGALVEARQDIAAAIGDKGLTLDAFDVRIAPASQNALAAPEERSGSETRQDQGFSHDGRSGQQERRGAPQTAARRDDSSLPPAPVGFLL